MKPASDGLVAGEPECADSVAVKPVPGEPAATKSAPAEGTSTEPGHGRPVAGAPAEHAAEERVRTEPAPREPNAEEPTPTEPATGERGPSEPALQKPVTAEPTPREPTPTEPPSGQPAVFATRRHRVAVLVRHGVMPLELGLVHQLFGSATGPDGVPLYEVVTCTPEPGLVRTDADFPVHVAHPVRAALEQADTVIVPASHEENDDRHPYAPLREAARRGVRIASICTGAFLLAEAGLLDGRRATTHWKSTDLFRRRFPAVTLDPDVLYTDNGPVLTSAGEAAGIDLCLHMIRCDHGAAVANDVARSTVVPPHREGGQAQFIPRPVPAPGGVSSTGRARAWALAHLDRPISLQQLAEQESTSVRTLTRRFREEAGLTPVQWLTRQRLGLARQLLEETDLPVDRVAADSGFGTGASLRQHMNAALGVSPRAYRATFRGPGGASW